MKALKHRTFVVVGTVLILLSLNSHSDDGHLIRNQRTLMDLTFEEGARNGECGFERNCTQIKELGYGDKFKPRSDNTIAEYELVHGISSVSRNATLRVRYDVKEGASMLSAFAYLSTSKTINIMSKCELTNRLLYKGDSLECEVPISQAMASEADPMVTIIVAGILNKFSKDESLPLAELTVEVSDLGQVTTLRRKVLVGSKNTYLDPVNVKNRIAPVSTFFGDLDLIRIGLN